MKIAVITGASSGLGVEFTKTIIKQYPKLDEIWIIARRKDRLKNLARHNLVCPPTSTRATSA